MKTGADRFRVIAVIVLLFSFGTAVARADSFGLDRLLGSWQSNRDLSIATNEANHPVSPAARQELENRFGSLILTFKDKELEGFMPAMNGKPEWRYSSPYAIVAATDSKLLIRHIAPATKRVDLFTITFDGPNRYWLTLDNSGAKECFDRLLTEPVRKTAFAGSD